MIEAIPADVRPRDVDEAYAVQSALVELLTQRGAGEPFGFKVGCTNQSAMELLGADGPFWGRLLRGNVIENGATVSLPESILVGVEPEFAYLVAQDIPAKEDGYDAASVAPFLEAVMPSIEIVGSRYADFLGAGVPSIVADNALNAAWVAGAARGLNGGGPDLAPIDVRVYVDEELAAAGGAENVLGHPLNVVAWLANELPGRGIRLSAGDHVTTGTCTPLITVDLGASVRCEFGPLGDVSAHLAG